MSKFVIDITEPDWIHFDDSFHFVTYRMTDCSRCPEVDDELEIRLGEVPIWSGKVVSFSIGSEVTVEAEREWEDDE